jgi:hypothetical protein
MKPDERARRYGACLVFGCASVLPAARGHADWETIPDITLEAEMNDNPALRSGADAVFLDEGSRLIADVMMRFRNAEPRGELTFEPRVRQDAYAEDEAQVLESTDVFLRSNGVLRGQTVRIGYSSDIAKERILGVEFLDVLPEDPLADDTTEIATTPVGLNEERTRFGVSPYVDIELNSRSTIVLDGRIVDVDYEADTVTGRSDFLDREIGGEYRHALRGQRGTLGVRPFATGYEAELNNNVTDTRGIEISYERAASELWSWRIMGGVQRADFALTSEGRRIRGSDDTPIWAIGLTKRAERSAMRTEIARRVSPDAAGFVAARDELRLSWTRMMSPRVSGRFDLRAIDSEGVNQVQGTDRQYGRAELGLDWQLRPTWSFVASYAYARSSSSTTIDGTADSNTLTLGIRYHGRSMRPGTLAE